MIAEGSPPDGVMVAAVQADLDRWGERVARTSLAAAALDIARRLDNPKLTPTPAAMLHTQLRAVLEALEARAPVEEDVDALDELQRRRDERRGA